MNPDPASLSSLERMGSGTKNEKPKRGASERRTVLLEGQVHDLEQFTRDVSWFPAAFSDQRVFVLKREAALSKDGFMILDEGPRTASDSA